MAYQNSQVSSVKVMFSDRGSIFLGIALIAIMLILSTCFLSMRVHKKHSPALHNNSKKALGIPFIVKSKKAIALPLHSKRLLLFYTPKKISHTKISQRPSHKNSPLRSNPL